MCADMSRVSIILSGNLILLKKYLRKVSQRNIAKDYHTDNITADMIVRNST